MLTPGERDALFVQYVNHAPQASHRRRQGRRRVGRRILDCCRDRGAGEARFAQRPHRLYRAADRRSARAAFRALSTTSPISRAPTRRLRQVKSAEEIDWLRIGAHFSDLGMAALRDGMKTGMSERELGDLVERAYVSQGATNVIHYIGTTSMSAPDLGVPRQFPTTRRVQKGDVWWPRSARRSGSIPGRCCAVSRWASRAALSRSARGGGRRVRRHCRVLKAGAAPADVIEASGVIEDAGFTIIDDLLHGYGGGYLPPILGARAARPGRCRRTVPRRADGGDPAQCGDARRQGRRADRRDGGDYETRNRAAARDPAGIPRYLSCALSMLFIQSALCERQR